MGDTIANQQVGGIGGGAEMQSVAMRENFWEECDDSQKIERLRGAIVTLFQRDAVRNESIRKLLNHQHGVDGQLLTAMFDGENSLSGYDRGPIPFNLRTERERGR